MERVMVRRDAHHSIASVGAGIHGKLVAVDWRSFAAFALPFLLYLATMAPTIYNLDSAEFSTAAYTGGIVRATGYPFYLLLGRLWSRVPFGDVGYRMNLLSAVSGALTIAVAERVLRRMRVGLWATLGALGLLGSAPFFWALSLVAEVYTLHTALMAVIVLLLMRWADAPSAGRLAMVALMMGLSAGNHAATVLLAPGVVWYVLTVAPKRALRPRSVLLSAGAFLAGLSIYLYLPLRYAANPVFNYAGHYDASATFVPINLQTPSGLLWLVSGKAFAGQMLAYSAAELWRETGHFAGQLWRAFFGFGIGPGLVGMVMLLRRNWRLGVMFVLLFACSAGFYINYRVVDKDTMFLPAYLVWALWVGFGLQSLLDWTQRETMPSFRDRGVDVLRAAIALVVLIAVVANWRLADLSDDWSARERGESILAVVDRNALVLGWWDTVPVIEYLQLVEGQRVDVLAINRFLITHDDTLQLIEREIAHRAVYVDGPVAGLSERVRFEPAGPVYRLWMRP